MVNSLVQTWLYLFFGSPSSIFRIWALKEMRGLILNRVCEDGSYPYSRPAIDGENLSCPAGTWNAGVWGYAYK